MFVNRDSFARTETHKERIYTTNGCAFCGQGRKTKSGRQYLWQFRREDDAVGVKSSFDVRLFCSIGCRRSYFT